MALKTVLSRDSGVQTDFGDNGVLDYKSDLPFVKNDKHVQFYGATGSKEKLIEVESKCSKTLACLSKWWIEPFMFLFMFSHAIGRSCIMNMMLDKACLIHLNYSRVICNNLSNYEDKKDEVEKLATVYSQYSTLISIGIGAVVMIFLGPWSDRYGRKPPIIITVIGFIVDDVGVMLNAIYFDARLEYLLLPSLASGLTGGFICIMSAVLSLASEITSEKNRTIKYAIIELTFGIGMSFGPLTGGLIYKFYSYSTVFIVATVGHVISLVWGIFMIQETRGLDVSGNVSWAQKLKDVFSLKNLSEGFKAYIKPRPNYGRLQLWLLLVSICLIVLTRESFANIAYVYAYHMYSWGPTQYSTVNTIFSAVGLVTIVTCMFFLIRYLRVKDSMIGLIGTFSMVAKKLCFAFATYTWIYYLGSTLGLLGGAGLLAVRSHISKIVEADELGKVFSFLTTNEALLPLAGTIAMTNIYNASLSFFPGLVYLVASALLIVPVLSFAWIVHLKTPENTIGKSQPETQPIVT